MSTRLGAIRDRDPFEREFVKLQSLLNGQLGTRRGLRVLDAGCGRKRHVELGDAPFVVGIDIAPDGLARNTSLDEKIQGDIQSHPLGSESFDVVLCWDVLEHLPRPGRALDNMAQALRPGGWLVIAGPNLLSLKGLITKLTPFAFHRWAYKYTAHAPETKPFRTFLRLTTTPSRIAAWARTSPHGLRVQQLSLYEGPPQVRLRRRLRLDGPAWDAIRRLAHLLTAGRFDPSATDFIIVIRRDVAGEAGDAPAQADAAMEARRALRGMCHGPYEPEAPRRSRRVDLLMGLARRRSGGVSTPHVSGASDEEKVQFEIEHGDEFWAVMGDAASIEQLRGKDVLDAGCGWGGKAIHLATHGAANSVCGFDLPGFFDPEVPTAMAAERGLTNCSFTTGYAEDMPFEDERFDVVLMEDVLEHVADPPAVLRECFRVLRPGGHLLARFPSIRMLHAHHLDRALKYPGLHYFASLETWAAGLNDYLLRHREEVMFEPVSEVRHTPYHKGVPANLNGLDLQSFRDVAAASPLKIERLGLAAVQSTRFAGRAAPLYPIYRALLQAPWDRERISRSIVFVARRP